MLRLWEHARDERIDDTVEDEVLDFGHGREKRGVPEQNVMKFVHDQHEEPFGCLRVVLDEIGVDQQARLDAALDRRGLHLVALNDIHEAQQAESA